MRMHEIRLKQKGNPSTHGRNRPVSATALKKPPRKSQITGVRAPGSGRVASRRQANRGHGSRWLDAFAAVEAFPALTEARERLISVLDGGRFSTAKVVAAIESDVALTIAVLRNANSMTPGRGRVESAVAAVGVLGSANVRTVAMKLRTFDFFDRSTAWGATPGRFRLHALATQHAADRIAAEVGCETRDRLSAISLLHDIGRLVLEQAYPCYPDSVHAGPGTPGDRIGAERRELGVDHALAGGVLIRRWGFPETIVSAIEHHHSREADGEAAIVRLADMLARHQLGEAVSPVELLNSGRTVGLEPRDLRRVLYELPTTQGQRPAHIDACPLSTRELVVLRRLAAGRVYKEIAMDLTVSTSAIRTHLHNIYGKLGALDRAQAVLMATDRGWL